MGHDWGSNEQFNTHENLSWGRKVGQIRSYGTSNMILIACFHRFFFIFMPQKELCEAYSNRTVCPSVPLRVRCLSPIFFQVGIPNLVCRCIFGWQSVAYHFRVTVTSTLTSDLVFIVITMSVCPSRFVSGAYLLCSLR